jgi:hypothetical protein
MMLTQIFLHATLRALSLAFGGFGVFFLWMSFTTPPLANYAIFFLTAASAITFALIQPEPGN